MLELGYELLYSGPNKVWTLTSLICNEFLGETSFYSIFVTRHMSLL